MQNTSCSPLNTYLATPEFVSLASYCLTSFTFPLNIFGGFVILFKTPDSMSSLRFAMLNSQLFNSMADLHLNFFVQPFTVTPCFMGFPLGFLAGVVPTSVLSYASFCLMFMVGSGFLLLLETRYNRFLGGAIWKKLRVMLHSFNCIYPLVFFGTLFFFFAPENQSDAISRCKYTYCDFEYPATTFALTEAFWYFFLGMSYFVTHLAIFTLFFVIRLHFHFRTTTQSEGTRKAQLRMQIALIVQISIPMLLICLPCINGTILHFFFGGGSTETNVIAFLMFSCHGGFATFVTLLVHNPYRRYVFWFCCRKKSFTGRVVAFGSRSV